MNIKILKNASSGFPGIAYSENKNEVGKGDLLVAKNFSLDNSNNSKSDYVKYMELVANKNTDVKYKQFHAVVTSRGQEYSFGQLKDAAIKYLEHMGYGDNPYLIYKHSDTANNHVHIVSTRVDKKGLKISDKFERLRTQRFIKNELNIDHGKTYDKSNFMDYRFSTRPQFKLLLEGQNFKVIDKKDHYVIYSGHEQKDIIKKSEVDNIIKNRVADHKNIAQIKALFHKFKPGMTTDAFIFEMRKKFGHEIVLHYARNKDPKIPAPLHERPYGYTVIDHRNKQVHKGSEIQPISFVLNELSEKEHREMLVYFLKREFDNPKLSLYDLNGSLRKLDYNADYRGSVHSKALGKDIFSIEPERLKSLLYHNKVHLINGYYTGSETAASVLKSYYKIDDADFRATPKIDPGREMYYGQIMEQYFSNKQFPREGLEKKRLKIVAYQGGYFLIDLKNKAIVPIPEIYNKSIAPELVDNPKTGQGQEARTGQKPETHGDLLAQYRELNLVPDLGSPGEDDDEEQRPKRKRKKRNNNQNIER